MPRIIDDETMAKVKRVHDGQHLDLTSEVEQNTPYFMVLASQNVLCWLLGHKSCTFQDLNSFDEFLDKYRRNPPKEDWPDTISDTAKETQEP